ncbi:EbsA family protein [Vagococcus xieshaowenii]|nr:EbsA family protein [Vagococcus xieshaowenii]QCA28582.1 hypothetical protein E4Z98_04355 [Vagococcus xieshaowenii]
MKKYRYQPDLAHTIIYWSFALCLLLGAAIITLEKITFSWLAVVLVILGVLLTYFGLRRRIVVQEHELIFLLGIPKKNKSLAISEVKKISIGSNGFTILHESKQGKKMEMVCMMKNRTLQEFVETVANHQTFQGDIVGRVVK